MTTQATAPAPSAPAKLYAWDFPTLDLATLTGEIRLSCTSEYKCTVLSATSDAVKVLCNPLGKMTIQRCGDNRLRIFDDMCGGSDVIRSITIGGAP